jgi:hypothetical protein
MEGRMFALVFTMAAFVIGFVAWLATRSRADDLRKRRLDLIEKGLGHPTLDEATRAELLRLLADEQRREQPLSRRLVQLAPLWRTLWFGASWLMFVVGGCMTAASALEIVPFRDLDVVLTMTIAGFAMLTLPAGLRELEARRNRASAPGR